MSVHEGVHKHYKLWAYVFAWFVENMYYNSLCESLGCCNLASVDDSST